MRYFRFHRVPPAESSSRMPRSREVVADAIGRGEVAAAAGGLALLDEPLDLLDRHRRPLVFGAPERQHAQHAIEAVESASRTAGTSPVAQLAGVDRRVERPHQIEHRRRAPPAVLRSSCIASANARPRLARTRAATSGCASARADRRRAAPGSRSAAAAPLRPAPGPPT